MDDKNDEVSDALRLEMMEGGKGPREDGDPEMMEQTPPAGIPVARMVVQVQVWVDAYGNVLPGEVGWNSGWLQGSPASMPPPPGTMVFAGLTEALRTMHREATEQQPVIQKAAEGVKTGLVDRFGNPY